MKKNLIILGTVVAAAVCLILLPHKIGTQTEQNEIIVTVAGSEYARIPLSQPQTLTVAQENGAVNVIEVTQDGAVMLSSTCENQLCVHMGEVTCDNWETRPERQFIICLPNRIAVELAVKP